MATDSWRIPPVISTRDKVYAVIRDKIVSGDLPHGARLTDTAVAERLGVSRTPVREAMARLLASGLLQPCETSGYRIVDPLENLEELILMRAALDGCAAHLAALRADTDQVKRINDLALRTAQVDRDDLETRKRLNAELHEAISDASGSAHLSAEAEIYRVFFASTRLMQKMTAAETEAALREHLEIAKAIADRDGYLAEEIARKHIHNAYRRILQNVTSPS